MTQSTQPGTRCLEWEKVASLGLEPRITESKSGVLPLHYEAFAEPSGCGARKLNRTFWFWQPGKSSNLGEISETFGWEWRRG